MQSKKKKLEERLEKLEARKPGFKGDLYIRRELSRITGERRYLYEDDGKYGTYIGLIMPGETLPEFDNPPWITSDEELEELLSKPIGWDGWQHEGLYYDRMKNLPGLKLDHESKMKLIEKYRIDVNSETNRSFREDIDRIDTFLVVEKKLAPKYAPKKSS